MNRKVFISFLGATNYGECRYVIDGEVQPEARYIQEVMLDYYSRQGWTKHDCAYILLTEIAKKKNWLDDGHKDKDTNETIKQPGLCKCLNDKSVTMSVETIEHIPMGNNEQEIMDIFAKIFDLLEENDELYFDITHGFRYLPIITLVLGNYSKFLKNVTVKWIGYGNYEGRDSTNTAPVIDLTALSLLQDWTTAAADFINNGNAKTMAELTRDYQETIADVNKKAEVQSIKKMAGAVSLVFNDMKCCRGENIINAKNIKNLINNLNKIERCSIKPIEPLIEKVKEFSNDFDLKGKKKVDNGFAAVNWCLKHEMLQQAATILQEIVITDLCLRHSLDYLNKEERAIASLAINVTAQNIPQSELNVKEEFKDKFNYIIANEGLLSNKRFVDIYNDLSDIRNDINHSGMRQSVRKVETIKDNLSKYYKTLYNIIIKCDNCQL